MLHRLHYFRSMFRYTFFYEFPFNQTCWILIGNSSLGILIAVIFLKGTRNLAGWKGNFAYWILRSIAFSSLLITVPSLIGYIVSLVSPYEFFYLDPQTLWWRLVGTSAVLPYFTIISFNILLTLHRLLVTLFPLKHAKIFPEKAAKIIFISIWSIHFILFFYCIVCPDAIFVFVKTELRFAIVGLAQKDLFNGLNEYMNYLFVGFSLFLYPIIFVRMYQLGSLSYRKNSDFRMTFQVALSISIELFYYIYWEYSSVGQGVFYAMDLSSEYSYSFAILLPYLILNQSIRKNLLQWCHRSAAEPRIVTVSSAARRIN